MPITIIQIIVLLIVMILSLFFGESVAIAQEKIADQPFAETLTLEGAIELAVKSNRTLQNAEIEIDKAKDKTEAYKTYRFPSFKVSALIAQPLTKFDFTFKKGVFGTYPNVGPIPNEDTKISSSRQPTMLVNGQVTQPLTQLYRINLNIKQLKAQQEITREQLRQKQQSVINEVKRAYFAILQTQSAKQTAEESVKLYRELERVTIQYVKQGTVLEPDKIDVQARLANSELELFKLNNLLATQKEQLNLLIGRDVRTDFKVNSMMEMVQLVMRETDVASAQKRALEQRPEIKTAQLRVKQVTYDKRAKKSEFIPDVSVTFSYLSPFNYSDVLPKSIMSIGVSVEWEAFDWGRKKHEVAEKDKSIKQAENDMRDVENQIVLEVNSSFRKLQEACQLLRVTKMSQTAATVNVQRSIYLYREGTMLLVDVLRKQTSLADAEYQYQKALLGFWQAKADFEKAIGEEK